MPILNTADAAYLGSQVVDAIYLGSTKIWPADETTPFSGTSIQTANTHLVLSNSNLTVFADGDFQHSCYAGNPIAGNSTVCIYWEVHVEAIDPSYHSLVGLRNVTASTDTDYTEGPGYVLSSDGGYTNMSGYTGNNYGAQTVGRVLKFCMKNGKLYIGHVDSGWANGGDPDAGTGYVELLTSAMVVPGCGFLLSAGESARFTFNFGASAWAGTPPTGATGWPSA